MYSYDTRCEVAIWHENPLVQCWCPVNGCLIKSPLQNFFRPAQFNHTVKPRLVSQSFPLLLEPTMRGWKTVRVTREVKGKAKGTCYQRRLGTDFSYCSKAAAVRYTRALPNTFETAALAEQPDARMVRTWYSKASDLGLPLPGAVISRIALDSSFLSSLRSSSNSASLIRAFSRSSRNSW